MKRPLLFMVLLSLMYAAAAPALACRGKKQCRNRRPGTHFLAELNVGGDLSGDLSAGGVIGIGGKMRNFPPRFYLVGEFTYSTSTLEGTLPDLPLRFSEEMSYRDLAFGLRVYLPVARRLRLFLDIMGGGTNIVGMFRRDDLSPLAVDTWSPLALGAVGLQARLLYNISVGVRARITFTEDSVEVRDLRGGSSERRLTMTGGLTWHF